MVKDNFIDKTAEGVVVGAVTTLLVPVLPPAGQVAFVAASAIIGGLMEHRKERTNDFFELFQDNPTLFSEQLVNDASFQDALFYVLNDFLKQRDERKRQALKRIMVGFVSSADRENFELEKMCSVLKLISPEDIEILLIWVDGTIESWLRKQAIYPEDRIPFEAKGYINGGQIGRLMLSEQKGLRQFDSEKYTGEKLAYLASQGLIVGDYTTNGATINSYTISDFGKIFIKFVQS